MQWRERHRFPRIGKKTRTFETLADIAISVCDALKAPKRLSVSASAVQSLRMNRIGGVEHYSLERAPYMREPMDLFASAEYNAVIFAGPAQSSKTESLILGSICYSVTVNPLDLMLVNPSQQNARDFATLRVDKMHRDSPDVGKMLLKRRDADSKGMKVYMNGMLLFLSWPTVTELSGKPIPRMLITDYDRMDNIIEGEASVFDMARKRTTTFGSFAMTVAESSPSKPLLTTKWVPSTKHEAPPTDGGILQLYNRGDRRRLYWPCPQCNEFFVGRFDMLEWDPHASVKAAAETVRMKCPTCATKITPDDRQEMLDYSSWLRDGEWIKNFKRGGEPLRSDIASFWLNGVAAGLSSWQTLVTKHLDAEREYKRTFDETALRAFVNLDLGDVYRSKAMEEKHKPEDLKDRAVDFARGYVPAGVRFLIAVVDVQKNMFVVNILGALPGRPFDMILVDTFDVRKSNREDETGDRLWVKPSAYLVDWDVLITEVMQKTYMLSDGSGRRMMIKHTFCDSAGYSKRGDPLGIGREGVTTQAYNFYRRLRRDGIHSRFSLTKGNPIREAPRTQITKPDAGQKGKMSIAKGDVPVILLNSERLKDDLHARLESIEEGQGQYLLPDWAEDRVFGELCAETKTAKGWENLGRARNEHWDLAYMGIGGLISEMIRIEIIDWDEPPGWAEQWDANDLVVPADQPEERFALDKQPVYDFASLGKKLA